jgi:DNA-binding response OmpR family regulator
VLLAARPSERGRSAEEALRAAGYSVTSVSPHEAWEAMNDLESGPLTAVVIEATPHEPAAGHGHWADLLARLRAGRDTWALPVLVLADGGDEATEVRALRWRATDVVAGTVRPRVLVARLRALLGRADRG